MKSIAVQVGIFIVLLLGTDIIATLLQPTDSTYASNIFLIIIAQLLAIVVIELRQIIKLLKK
jgi:hypothetical protein